MRDNQRGRVERRRNKLFTPAPERQDAANLTSYELNFDVQCAGSTHCVSWRNGKLLTLDHEMDVEHVAATLGSPLPACVDLALAWTGQWTDLDLLALISPEAAHLNSGFAPGMTPPPRRGERIQQQWAIAKAPQIARTLFGVSVANNLGDLEWLTDSVRHTGPDWPLGFEDDLRAAIIETLPIPAPRGLLAVFRKPAGCQATMFGLATTAFWAATVFVSRSWKARVLDQQRSTTGGELVVDWTASGPEVVTWTLRDGLWQTNPSNDPNEPT